MHPCFFRVSPRIFFLENYGSCQVVVLQMMSSGPPPPTSFLLTVSAAVVPIPKYVQRVITAHVYLPVFVTSYFTHR